MLQLISPQHSQAISVQINARCAVVIFSDLINTVVPWKNKLSIGLSNNSNVHNRVFTLNQAFEAEQLLDRIPNKSGISLRTGRSKNRNGFITFLRRKSNSYVLCTRRCISRNRYCSQRDHTRQIWATLGIKIVSLACVHMLIKPNFLKIHVRNTTFKSSEWTRVNAKQ